MRSSGRSAASDGTLAAIFARPGSHDSADQCKPERREQPQGRSPSGSAMKPPREGQRHGQRHAEHDDRDGAAVVWGCSAIAAAASRCDGNAEPQQQRVPSTSRSGLWSARTPGSRLRIGQSNRARPTTSDVATASGMMKLRRSANSADDLGSGAIFHAESSRDLEAGQEARSRQIRSQTSPAIRGNLRRPPCFNRSSGACVCRGYLLPTTTRADGVFEPAPGFARHPLAVLTCRLKNPQAVLTDCRPVPGTTYGFHVSGLISNRHCEKLAPKLIKPPRGHQRTDLLDPRSSLRRPSGVIAGSRKCRDQPASWSSFRYRQCQRTRWQCRFGALHSSGVEAVERLAAEASAR